MIYCISVYCDEIQDSRCLLFKTQNMCTEHDELYVFGSRHVKTDVFLVDLLLNAIDISMPTLFVFCILNYERVKVILNI